MEKKRVSCHLPSRLGWYESQSSSCVVEHFSNPMIMKEGMHLTTSPLAPLPLLCFLTHTLASR